jgi:hypothetical protein
MNRKELLEEISAGRERLEAALAVVDPTRVEEVVLHGEWTVKDLLGHLEFWENRIQSLYQILVKGQNPDSVSPDIGLNALNQKAYEANRRRPFDEIRRTELAAYRGLIRLAQSASEDELFGPDHFVWTGGQPFANWLLDNSSGHFDEHLPELKAWLGQTKSAG